MLLANGPFRRTFLWVLGTVTFFFANLFIIYYFVQKDSFISAPVAKNTESKLLEKVDLYSCDIEDPLAIDALKRVKTESCKLKLTEAACKVKYNVFHDTFPVSACENHDNSIIGAPVGCFEDNSTNRTLTEFRYDFKEDNSLEKCQSHCYRAGFLYFGVEFGKECFCGNDVRAAGLPEIRCQEYKCPGNRTIFCGGYNAVEIFRTGLRSAIKNPPATYVNLNDLPPTRPSVKIMFLLQLNGRNDRQVKRLLKAIYSPSHLYYIHVDQRQLYLLTEMKAVAGLLPNVYVAPDGHSTIWGGASLLSMVQEAIRRSLTMPDFAMWDYMINLSESDFPVLSLQELEAQLAVNNGKTYLASHGYNAARFIQKQGFEYVFMECEERMWRIAKRNEFPQQIRLDGGSDWLVLHRKFAEYSISTEELPTKMRKLFSSIILPVESFFHTLAFNSKFCDSIFSSHLRITNWNRAQGCRCASLKKVVDWCGCSPLVWKTSTASKFALHNIINKSQYIARKFESLIDIDAVAIAEAQSYRYNPEIIPKTHPSFNSTFVNFFKTDIDGYSLHNYILAENLLKFALPDVELLTLHRIDIFKANSSAPHQIVFSIQTSQGRKQLLVKRLLRSFLFPPAINDGFELTVAQFGVNIDHKEEIFRSPTSFIDSNGVATIALRYKRLPGVSSTVASPKTSPSTAMVWINSDGKEVAKQIVPQYDSIYGTLFSSLDLSQLDPSLKPSGNWKVRIEVPTSEEKIAEINFPVFNTSNIQQFSQLVQTYFAVIDSCSTNCDSIVWSISYPDPKSDVITGWDKSLKLLV